MMEDLQPGAERLAALRLEAEQGGLTPDLVERMTQAVKEMRAAAEQALERAKNETLAQVTALRAEAEQAAARKAAAAEEASGQAAAPAEAGPWDECQGISPEEIDGLAAKLLAAARSV